jgi:hypothetical protein
VQLTDGTPILPDTSQTFTFAVTDFTNLGGDSYFMLADGGGTSFDRDANVFLADLNEIGTDLDPADFPQNRIFICPCP